MRCLANDNDQVGLLRGVSHPSRHHIDCRQEWDGMPPTKTMRLSSHKLTSIGGRRYLMTVERLSNHSTMIIPAQSAVYLHVSSYGNRYLQAGPGGCGRSLVLARAPSYDSLRGCRHPVVSQNSGCGAAFSRGMWKFIVVPVSWKTFYAPFSQPSLPPCRRRRSTG